jgi:hypothetical protein
MRAGDAAPPLVIFSHDRQVNFSRTVWITFHCRGTTSSVLGVYTGNVHDMTGGSTWCGGCGALLIGRDWFDLTRWHLAEDGCCMDCGTRLPGVFEARPGNWGARRQPVLLRQ